VSGYFAAGIAVLVWASYPVATRGGVTGWFAPDDLVALRFGAGALLFLPYLLLQWNRIGRTVWVKGVPLALFQGAGMGALAIYGMQFAPANHAAALGPGVNAAWVALLGFLLFARQPTRRAIAGAILCVGGVLLVAGWSAAGSDPAALLGDAMFVCASALGALYILQLQRWGIGAMQGAALVSLYSACVVVPYYLWFTPLNLARVPPSELLWQILWQGILIGCVALIALNYAIFRLGAARSSALVALVPVLTAVLGFLFLGELPSAVEVAAFALISAGVSIGAAPPRLVATRAVLPLAALPQSAPRARYRVRDSVP
jgi:drug/metabolite transporter (DMT)-like permease